MPTLEEINQTIKDFPPEHRVHQQAVKWLEKYEKLETERKERIAKEEILKATNIKKQKILEEAIKSGMQKEIYADIAYICEICGEKQRTERVLSKKLYVNDEFKAVYREETYEDCLIPECEQCISKRKEIERKAFEESLKNIKLSDFGFIPPIYHSIDFDYELAKSDLEKIRNGSGLFLVGGTGTHKTWRVYNMLALYEKTKNKFDKFYFSSLNALFTTLKSNFKNASMYCDEWATANLFCIDDLGTELGSDYELAFLYEVINYRWEYKLPIVVTCNTKLSEWMGKHGDMGVRIGSRLADMTETIEMKGSDDRIKKKMVKEVLPMN